MNDFYEVPNEILENENSIKIVRFLPLALNIEWAHKIESNVAGF